MKVFFTTAFLFLSLLLFSQTTYSGNGGTGFGGPIGGSTLMVSDNGTTITFQLTTGVPFSGNALVIYIDSKAGGPSNTSTFTDVADGGRTAISGLSANGRTLVNFAPGFNPDFALTVEPGVFSGLFDLSTPDNFGFVASAGLSGSGTTFTFSVNKTDLGIPSGSPAGFRFVGTLISTSAYRSNETIGTSTTVPGNAGDTPNAGFTGTQTFSNFNSYGTITLPVKLLRFTGKAVASQVQLSWATANDNNYGYFVIENSTTGAAWTTLATVTAKKGAAEYIQSVAAGADLYRLKMVESNGNVSYSSILNLKAKAGTVTLLANPAIGAVRMSVNADAGNGSATLYSLQGSTVASQQLRHAGGVSHYELPVMNAAKGSYLLKVTIGGQTKSFNVVVQ